MARMPRGPFRVKVYDNAGNLVGEGPCTQVAMQLSLGRRVLDGSFSVSMTPQVAHTLSPDADVVRPPAAPLEPDRRPCWNCGSEGLGQQQVGQPCKRCGKTI